MVRRSAIRASDEDREQVAERLRHATIEGRLAAEELEERLTLALSARTYGELDALIADLPREGRAVGLQRRPASAVQRWVPPAVALAVIIPAAVALVAAAVAVVTGLFLVWLLWLAVAWSVFGRRRMMHMARAGHRGGANVMWTVRRLQGGRLHDGRRL